MVGRKKERIKRMKIVPFWASIMRQKHIWSETTIQNCQQTNESKWLILQTTNFFSKQPGKHQNYGCFSQDIMHKLLDSSPPYWTWDNYCTCRAGGRGCILWLAGEVKSVRKRLLHQKPLCDCIVPYQIAVAACSLHGRCRLVFRCLLTTQVKFICIALFRHQNALQRDI